MRHAIRYRRFVLAASFLAASSALTGFAGATGTAEIQTPNGPTKTYQHVHIAIWNDDMAVTSADGKGTVVFGKAACTRVGALIRCLPYDAMLFQNGQQVHIVLRPGGTVWLNPSHATQHLSQSSTQLPPRGVLLAVQTRRGTYVTLTGTVDEVHR
jgi:hypothetical protein